MAANRAETVLLAVQGPEAAAAVEAVLGTVPGKFRVVTGTCRAGPFWSAGTGYTGERGAEIAVVEVGLGGRLDATNILPPEAVELSLISRIGIDHQHFLGDGIEAIAREKAGIFKPGVRAFFAPQQEAVRTILLEEADRLGTLALPARPVEPDVTLGLPGGFQRDNAGLAAAAAADLGIDEASIAAGLAQAQWAARLSLITSGTLWQEIGRAHV